jgi:hypothetical protein
MPTQIINLNDALPAAPANTANVKWQADAPSLDPAVVRDVSAYMPAATAAALGLIKGDNATVILAADGTASVPKATSGAIGVVKPDNSTLKVDGAGKLSLQALAIGFGITSGAIGSAITLPVLAPRTGGLTSCAVVIQASDGALNLSFRIKQNGVDVFTSDPVIPAGTAGGTVLTFPLSSASIAVAQNDVFTMDITVGSSSWKFTAQLE